MPLIAKSGMLISEVVVVRFAALLRAVDGLELVLAGSAVPWLNPTGPVVFAQST